MSPLEPGDTASGRPIPLHDDALVERTEELGQLARLCSIRGPLRHAFIEGAAGMGKSRLLSEFLAGQELSGVRVLRGYCYQDGDLGPYAPFRQILGAPTIQADTPSDPSETVTLARFEPGLDKDVEGPRGRLIDALAAAVIDEAGHEQTVLSIEDTHWADVGALILLNRILDTAPDNLLIICTYRSDEGVDADTGNLILRVAQRSTPVVLGALSRDGVREIAAQSRYASVRLTRDELDLLADFTRGNPMFVGQMLMQLEESRILETQTLREALDTATLPEHLAGLIDLRLRTMAAEELDALSASAVIGQTFSAELTSHAIASSIEHTEELLDASVRRRILRRRGGREALGYEFSHPIFVKQLCDITPLARRRVFHTRIAAASGRGEASLTIEELAWHLAVGPGSEAPESVARCIAAATNAEQVYAFDRAAQFWDLARLCSRDDETRAEVLRRLGWSLWYSRKWDRTKEAWRAAIALIRARANDERVAELALALGDMHRWRQEHDDAERWLTLAVEAADGNHACRSHALALLGSLHCLQAKEDGVALLEEAQAATPEAHRDPLVAYWVSYGLLVSGDRDRSYWTARSGLRDARRRGSQRAVALLAASLFHHDLGRLRPKRAAYFTNLLRRVTDRSDPTAMIRAMLCEALLLGYAGSWHDAAGACESWLSSIRLAGRFQVATASVVWSEAQAALGNVARAEPVLRRVLPDLEQARGVAAIHLARLLAREGDRDEAASLFEEHGRAIAESPRFSDAAGKALLGEVASLLEDAKTWERTYDLLLREPYPLVMTYSPVSVPRILGRLACRLRRWSNAFRYFEAAAGELARGAARGELLRTLLDHAEGRRQRGRRGDSAKADALETEASMLADTLGLPAPGTNGHQRSEGNRFNLTARELEVLERVAAGLRNQEIAEALSIAQGTANRHLENIFMKTGARTRTEAVMLALQERLLGPSPNGD